MQKAGFALAILALALQAAGQTPTTSPTKANEQTTTAPAVSPVSAAETQPSEEVLAGKVTVVSVSGPAEKLVASAEQDKQTWVALKQGEILDEMTLIRTGFRAKVVLRFADRAEVVVNNASKMGIAQFRRKGNAVNAQLGLKYGTIRASIERGRGPNDFKIATPVATLSVQGSGANVAAMVDSPMVVQSFSGAWRTETSSGTKTVRAGEATNKNLTQWANIAQNQRATKMAAAGQTPREKTVLVGNSGGRGIIGLSPSNSSSGGVIIAPPPPPARRRPPCPPPPVPPPNNIIISTR